MNKTTLTLLIACLGGLLLAAPRGVSGQSATLDPRFGVVDAHEDPDAAEQAAASWEIVTFRWSDIQPQNGDQWVINGPTDEWLATAQAQGREVVGLLIGTPEWASTGAAETGVPAGLDLPADDPGNTWASFVREAAGFYAGRGINRWIIWDQPDLGSAWDGTEAEYYQLVRTAYIAARQANPQAEIHLGGLSYNDPAWFGRFLDEALNDTSAQENNYYFDVVSVDLDHVTEDAYTRIGNLYFSMSQRAIPLRPVWVNRIGARPAQDAAYTSPPDFREFPNVTEDQQASYIVQAHALAFAAGADRLAVYRLVDDLEADDGQAFGLLRRDGTQRPAYAAYSTLVEQMSGFVFVRRVDEEAFPLVDYVRFTFTDRVTHVAWARTELDATLIIPARSAEAELMDMQGRSTILQPQDGLYRVGLGGTACDDPLFTCLIGGQPWYLIERGVEDPINSAPPSVTVEEGGAPFVFEDQPDPTPTPDEAEPQAAGEVSADEDQPEAAADEAEVAAAPLQPDQAEEDDSPQAADPPPAAAGPASPGWGAALPYLLMGLGVLIIGGGVWYYARPVEAPAVAEAPAALRAFQEVEDEPEPSAAPVEGELPQADDQPEEAAQMETFDEPVAEWPAKTAPDDVQESIGAPIEDDLPPDARQTQVHQRPEWGQETREHPRPAIDTPFVDEFGILIEPEDDDQP